MLSHWSERVAENAKNQLETGVLIVDVVSIVVFIVVAVYAALNHTLPTT